MLPNEIRRRPCIERQTASFCDRRSDDVGVGKLRGSGSEDLISTSRDGVVAPMAHSDEITAIGKLPTSPAVYALYGGRDGRAYVAYVGMAVNLRRRIFQHLVTRDSSVTTGMSAVGLRPEYVTEIRWWEHQQFDNRAALGGAELVAFDILDPALRSRGGVSLDATSHYKDEGFRSTMKGLFGGQPTGRLRLPDVNTLLEEVLGRLSKLEKRVERIGISKSEIHL